MDVVTALHKHSVIHEPRFFNPHLVILEDKLCRSDDVATLGEMFKSFNGPTHVLVIGVDGMNPQAKALGQGHKIIETPKLPPNLSEFLEKRVFNGQVPTRALGEPDAAYLASDSEFSRIEILTPARLTGLHPLGAELALPYAMGNFGLCRVESPLLRKLMGHKPFAKITASYPDPLLRSDDFPFRVECALSDMTAAKRATLAEGLKRLYAEELMAQLESVQPTPPPRSLSPPFAAEVTGETPAPLASPLSTEEPSPEALAYKALSLPASMETPMPRARPVGRRHPVENRELAKMAAIFLAAGLIFALCFWLSLAWIEPNYGHSGANYSDQLKKFRSRHATPSDTDAH